MYLYWWVGFFERLVYSATVMWKSVWCVICLCDVPVVVVGRGVATGGVWGVSHPLPPKIFFKNRENLGKLRNNSVTSGNICGC